MVWAGEAGSVRHDPLYLLLYLVVFLVLVYVVLVLVHAL